MSDRNYEQELANINNDLAESVIDASDDDLLEEEFEQWWQAKGLDGDDPSALFTPADDYSKFDFGLMCFKAGFEKAEELGKVYKRVDVRIRRISKGVQKSYCWKCTNQFPISEMRVEENPYLTDGLDKGERVYICKGCIEEEEESEAGLTG